MRPEDPDEQRGIDEISGSHPPSGHVWGIGLGRTGTASLTKALQILGYNPAYHNPTFGNLLNAQAATDAGTAIFYKFLDYRYAGSKFILTLRNLEEWLESFEAIHKLLPAPDRGEIDSVLRRMQLYGTVHFDRDMYTEAYHRHHAEVRHYFKDRPSDLLEMRIVQGEGWEKLCPFLEVPIPNVDFPRRDVVPRISRRRSAVRRQLRAGAPVAETPLSSSPEQKITRDVVFSCVVDGKPIFTQQCLTLIWTLVENAGVEPGNIVVHVTPTVSDASRGAIVAQGVNVRDIMPISADYPHLNKLHQLTSPELQRAGIAVLCDCDLAFVRDIRSDLDPERVLAAVVDKAVPPIRVWEWVLSEAGLSRRHEDVAANFDDGKTIFENRNGGFYSIPGSMVAGFYTPWRRWAEWLISRADRLGRWSFHIGQIAFALTCLENDIEVRTLPASINFPIHLGTKRMNHIAPAVIHYHRETNASGMLRRTKLPLVDLAIRQVNTAIKKRRRVTFDNASFWDFRYAEHPTLGSGYGSRGEPLAFKRALLADLTKANANASILDVGCGDVEAMNGLSAPVSYTGIDISGIAIKNARKRYPGWAFLHGDFLDVEVPDADIVLCFDVLIHQPSPDKYVAMLGKLIAKTKQTLVVSGYLQAPSVTSEITFYHQPLTDTIREFVREPQIEVVGFYRDTSVLKVTIAPARSGGAGAAIHSDGNPDPDAAFAGAGRIRT